MKRFWPWKRIAELEADNRRLKAQNTVFHTRIEKLEYEAETTSKHVRKMASIIAIKGGMIG